MNAHSGAQRSSSVSLFGKLVSRALRGQRVWPVARESRADTAWSRSLVRWEEFSRTRPKADHPAGIAPAGSFGALHSAIAVRLLEMRREITDKAVAFEIARRVVAVVDVRGRKAFIRGDADIAETQGLSAAVKPRSSLPLELQGFDTHDLRSLLWHYGQTEGSAAQSVPAIVGQQRLRLRKVPQVARSQVGDRHADIFRLLSMSALTFDQLQGLVKPGAVPYLCGDVAALFLTGSLLVESDLMQDMPTLVPMSQFEGN